MKRTFSLKFSLKWYFHCNKKKRLFKGVCSISVQNFLVWVNSRNPFFYLNLTNMEEICGANNLYAAIIITIMITINLINNIFKVGFNVFNFHTKRATQALKSFNKIEVKLYKILWENINILYNTLIMNYTAYSTGARSVNMQIERKFSPVFILDV